MKFHKLITLALLANTLTIFSGNTITKIVPRSQSLNAARQIVGWNNPCWGIDRKPQDDFYASMNLITEYTRTFRDERMARCLFGDDLICRDCGPALAISGSQRSDRGPADWLADYFGLPRDYKSVVTFKPRISNFLLDMSFYVGLDQWVEGLYFRIHAPFVHTSWNLGAQETCTSGGSVGYFQGYFGPHNADTISKESSVDPKQLNQRFLDYTNGCTPTLPDDISWQPLCCGKITNDCACDSLTRNGFGEIRCVLGWNFLNDDEGEYHLGTGIYVAAPTGNRPGDGKQGCSLFEPIIGNGKHWELGGQVTAHHIWWHSDDDDAQFGFFMEANIMHLFSATQTRCFDLCCNGSNSRYMIAQRLKNNSDDDPKLDGNSNADLAFANEFAPVANITHREVKVSIGAQADIALTLQYKRNHFSWDVGYDFWAKSCENICIQNECCPQALGTWALKGDNRVYGFVAGSEYEYPDYYPVDVLPVPVAATDSKATIHRGSNLCNGVNYTPVEPEAPNNLFGDSPIRATASVQTAGFTNEVVTLYADQAMAADPLNQLYTSKNPILIQECDFDTRGGRGISHKVFTHINWAWPDHNNSTWTPYLGLGAEVEFGKVDDSCCQPQSCASDCKTTCNPDCTTNCSTGCQPTIRCEPCCPSTKTCNKCCVNCAISQWGVWFKVGASYN